MARRSPRSARSIAALILAGLSVIASCTIFNGLTARDRSDGGPDAQGIVPPSDAADPCTHIYPPVAELTDNVTDPGVDVQDFVVVARNIGVRGPDAGSLPPIGYDLDGVCTCVPHPTNPCRPPGDKLARCDGDGGVDNAAAALSAEFTGVSFTDTANRFIEEGKRAVLIRVERYNGQANDNDVLVEFYPSSGSVVRDGGTRSEPPRWDEEDVWSLDNDHLENVAQRTPKVRATATVKNFRLVAHPTSELPLEPDTRLVFRAGVFSARVGRTASGRYTLLDAVIAGRLDANDVVDSIFRREFTFGGVKNELCTFSSGDAVLFQNFVVETVCAERDITVAEITTADGGVLCDGLSAAAPLDFFPARLGPSKASSPSTVCGEIPRCPR